MRLGRRWHTGFDLIRLTTGSSKILGLHSGTVNDVCQRYAKSRAQYAKPYLRYRGRKNLGWVPIKGRSLKRDGDAFRFNGTTFRVFYSRPLPLGNIRDGTNFSQDCKGNWYLNIVVDVAEQIPREPVRAVGIDLGLNCLATLSNSEKIPAPHFYRDAEPRLAKTMRAGKRKQIKKIHRKIANQRADFLHKVTTRITREFDYIVIGKIGSTAIARTKLAKAVHDVSWSTFRKNLAYKAIKHGAWFEEVDESFTTQICSSCGTLPDSRPKGIADLGIREWKCSGCDSLHDRDVNAAINILRRGRATLVVGTPVA